LAGGLAFAMKLHQSQWNGMWSDMPMSRFDMSIIGEPPELVHCAVQLEKPIK
jgi:hypothetical protein